MIDKELNIYHGFLFKDPNAMSELVSKYSERFLRLAYLYTRDSAAAEDVVENTFALAFVNQKVFDHNAQFKTYLYRLLHLCCRQYQRKHRNATPIKDIEEILSTPSFEQITAQNVQFKYMYEAMAQLPAQYAELMYLAYFNNLPVDEIAEITKMSKGKIYHKLERAKPVMKKVMARDKQMRAWKAEQERLAGEESQTQNAEEGDLDVASEAPDTETEQANSSTNQTQSIEGAQES